MSKRVVVLLYNGGGKPGLLDRVWLHETNLDLKSFCGEIVLLPCDSLMFTVSVLPNLFCTQLTSVSVLRIYFHWYIPRNDLLVH